MGRLLNSCYLVAYLLAFPWIAYRHFVSGGWPAIGRRFGSGLGEPISSCIWLHASSVGEVTLLRPLVALLSDAFPDSRLVISAYTSTGIATAQKIYPQHRVIAFPFDFQWIARRCLKHLQPRMVVIVESELWPNFISAVHRWGVPVAIVNGKISERSFKLHARTGFVSEALRNMALVAVQSELHAERMRRLGVDPDAIRVTGNMKYDSALGGAELASGRDTLRARYGYTPADVVLIGASLHAGEDSVLLAACSRLTARHIDLALVLVPRYPDDAPKVAEHVRGFDLAPVRKTELDASAVVRPGRAAVLIVDTLGELASLYAIADLAFVGGSLFHRGSSKGGHNLMEPALFGIPVLFGPYNFSFHETAEVLRDSNGGTEIANEEQLIGALEKFLADPKARRAAGDRARQVIIDRQGASARTVDLLVRIANEPARKLAGGRH